MVVTPPGHHGDMDAQLRLIAPRDLAPSENAHAVRPSARRADQPSRRPLPKSWRLTTTTREIGRKGVAQAREALQQARRTGPADAREGADRSRAA